MKKLITAAIALSCLAIGTADAATWKVSHVRPQGTAIDKDLHWFADEVKKATDGKIRVKVYAASSLGDYTVVQERVSVGAVEMACQPAATAADKRFQLVYFPYMVKGWEQAKKNYSTGAPLRGTIDKLYAEQDIKVLAAWPVYFGGVALNKAPRDPAGIPNANQGLKVRVPGIKTFQMLANELGFQATPIAFSEAFTAVQTGVVDGVVGSGAEGYYASFRDVTKYYLPLNTHFEVWYLLINNELYGGLDAAQKKQLDAVALAFEKRRWGNAEADQAANEKRLADHGAEIIAITPAQIAETAKKIRADVWPEILNDVGKEWGQKVMDSIVD